MATNELIRKLTELADLRKMAEDLNAEIEAIQEEVKAHMTAEDTDTLTAGQFKVTWKEVTSTRIDTTALRKDLPEIWQEYGNSFLFLSILSSLCKQTSLLYIYQNHANITTESANCVPPFAPTHYTLAYPTRINKDILLHNRL